MARFAHEGASDEGAELREEAVGEIGSEGEARRQLQDSDAGSAFGAAVGGLIGGAFHAASSPPIRARTCSGAAKRLATEGGFDGIVRFLFQPAEEWGKGALAMLGDGLMERFAFDEVYGIHNLPGLPVGLVQTRAGAIMSAENNFEIILKGVGGHAARPHWGREVLVAACALVMDLQTIVSRRLSPTDIGVVSVTELLTDGTRNALPGIARILGDARSFRPEVSAVIEREMGRVAAGIALTYDCAAKVTYTREFVPLLNDTALVAAVLDAARTVPGLSATTTEEPITMSEDFARFLDHVPGVFAFVGNGKESAPLHNPSFDFNDAALPYGTELHMAIVRHRLRLT